MQGLQGEAGAAAAELGELKLPGDIQILDLAGKGARAVTFKAVYRGEPVALKIYRPEVVTRYRKKHDLNIAVFEMSQNRKFRRNEELFPFSAKPIMVLGHDGKLSLCFIQEFIEGIPLAQLGEDNRGLPLSILEAGEIIARAGNDAGLRELDLDYRNVLVRQKAGKWLPVIHDFNRVQGVRGGGLGGIFKDKARDNLQLVREWFQYSEECGRL
jgi:predicted Ser/Thr protein kinase